LSTTFFNLVLSSVMNTLICDTTKDTEGWPLYYDNSIRCNSYEHMIYLFFGILTILLYYPLSVFLYPVLQSRDKALDVKLHPIFLLLQV